MAITKTLLFTEEQQKTAEILKAMGHPARIAILEILNNRQSCFCGDITEELPLAQSTVSQHLKALKNAGLIQGDIDGVRTCYCLSETGIEILKSLAIPFIQQLDIETKKSCC